VRCCRGAGGILLKVFAPSTAESCLGAPALGYVGSQTFFDDDNGFTRLIGCDQEDLAPESSSKNPKVVICGGKGGVGKTTTSSSLAIAMASAGHDVAVVSTDPAHSLGDALDMDLRGGSLVDVPLFGVAPPPMVPGVSPLTAGEGSLKAMEIDPTSALKEFRDSIDDLIGKKNDSDGSSNSELSSALNSLGEIIDTLPAGTDEVVALAKVVQLVKRNGFDRVVLDTAPTGHTLRMLTTPAFLADLIERVLSVAQKTSANPAVRALLSGVAASQNQKKEDVADAAESARAALLKFQVSMYDLEDLFADPASTEFLIVTIGTELAVRESVRLLNELTFGDPDMPIRVCNVVVNQVLDSGGSEEKEEEEKLRGFVTRLTRSQSSSIAAIERAVDELDNPPRVTKVTMLDMEPRGVYGLKALSEQLLLSEQTEVLNNA
jgi:arsenite-transporting ATPase